jgi:hypothetical protein
MKVKVSLDGLPEVPQENLLPLRGRVLILMDSSALLRMARGEVPEPPSNERTLPCICDFIKRESINQENRNVPSRERKVRGYLRSIDRSATWKYAEASTPFIAMPAERRDSFLHLLPKKVRNLLLDEYRSLSGTDKCLLIVAIYLLEQGIPVNVLTYDGDMRKAWEKLLQLRSSPP